MWVVGAVASVAVLAGAWLLLAPGRQAALKAGLKDTVSATQIGKVCGSGLKAAMLASAMIRAGDADVMVAGGMENMNRGPYLLPSARFGYRLGTGEILDATVHDGLWCAFENWHMGMADSVGVASFSTPPGLYETEVSRALSDAERRLAGGTVRLLAGGRRLFVLEDDIDWQIFDLRILRQIGEQILQ